MFAEERSMSTTVQLLLDYKRPQESSSASESLNLKLIWTTSLVLNIFLFVAIHVRVDVNSIFCIEKQHSLTLGTRTLLKKRLFNFFGDPTKASAEMLTLYLHMNTFSKNRKKVLCSTNVFLEKSEQYISGSCLVFCFFIGRQRIIPIRTVLKNFSWDYCKPQIFILLTKFPRFSGL